MYQAIPPGPAQYWPVGSDSTTFDITGLNGDADGDYWLSGYILLPNSVAPTVSVQPNALSANQRTLTSGTAPAAAVTPSSVARLDIDGFSTAATGTPYIRFTRAIFTTLTTRVRRWDLRGHADTGTAFRRVDSGGVWTDTTTNITSIRISVDVASAIKAGSWFVLEKLGVHG